MKNRIYVSVFAVAMVLSATSCSKDFNSDYDYNDSYNNYSQYHNEPPKKTLPAKIIFDYTFDGFSAFPNLMTCLVGFNSSVNSLTNGVNGYMSEKIGDTMWKLTDNNYVLVINTNGKPITENGAQWDVLCNIYNCYIPQDGCKLTNTDGKITISVSSGRFGNRFQTKAELDVTWKENLLDRNNPYLFTFNGSGTFTDTSDTDFAIKFSTATPFVGVDTSLFTNSPYRFFNGTLNISTERQGNAIDVLTATLESYDQIVIKYNDVQETWKYIMSYHNYYPY